METIAGDHSALDDVSKFLVFLFGDVEVIDRKLQAVSRVFGCTYLSIV